MLIPIQISNRFTMRWILNSIQYFFWFLSVIFFDMSTKYFWDVDHYNRGIAFGFFQSISVGLLVALWLFGWWWSFRFPVARWSHALFWGAAFANILDRIIWGGVRDIWLLTGSHLVGGVYNNAADWVLIFITLYWGGRLIWQERHATNI